MNGIATVWTAVASRHDQARLLLAVALVLTALPADAGRILDHIRNTDLNNYALGMTVAVSQRPYVSVKNSVIVYPYLTAFQYHAFTDDWLLLTEGELGLRRVIESGWEFGLTGRIETLGFGSEVTDELLGMDHRQWTIEAAPFATLRRFPIHATIKPFKEISGRHGGWNSQFRLSWPIDSHWGYFVPLLQANYQDSDYTNYYYGVKDYEARPDRPEYSPGSAVNYTAGLRLGYRITDHWLLSASLNYEILDDEIVNSPIVEHDQLWSGHIGLAYNADVFQRREYGPDNYTMPTFEFRVGLFQDNISTELIRDDVNGNPGEIIQLEDLLAASDAEAVLQFDAIYRFNNYHRIEAGYLDLSRDSFLTLETDLRYGDEQFDSGTEIEVRSDMRLMKLSYAFSLMNDAQKELGLMVGVHVSRLQTEISSSQTGQRELSSASTPLPAAGAHGSITLGNKTRLGARLQMYRMQFDHYEGSMNYMTIDLQHAIGQHTSIGIGYNYYALKLDSDISEINGSLDIVHYGPFISLGAHF